MSKTVHEIYEGSNGEETKELYARLAALGPVGLVGLNLFRAQKCSARAKEYRKGAWKREAYDRKNWSLANLSMALVEHAPTLGIRWGWKLDLAAEGPHCWVIYIELPTGQVSFHSGQRGPSTQPTYPGEWDRSRASAERILAWCATLLGNPDPATGAELQPMTLR